MTTDNADAGEERERKTNRWNLNTEGTEEERRTRRRCAALLIRAERVTQDGEGSDYGGFGAEDIFAERDFVESGGARGFDLVVGPASFRADG